MNKEKLKADFNKLPTILLEKRILVDKSAVQHLVDQLDELQKVVVPKWVADCIDYAKEHGCTLYQTLGFTFYKDFAEDYVVYTQEWAEWLVVPKNQEILARAWLDGYEVE